MKMQTEMTFKTVKEAHDAGYLSRKESSALLAGSGLKIFDVSEHGYGYKFAVKGLDLEDPELAHSVELWFTDEPNKIGRLGGFGAWFKRDEVGLALKQHLKSVAAATLGQLGGASKSEAKITAARENGKKGGRPKK